MTAPGVAELLRVRRHHAIEHATIAVLFQQRGGMVSVVGRSDLSGFHLYGSFAPQEVEVAVEEAIARLRSGESNLAVTPLCGTNIAVTAVLAGSAALIAAGRKRSEGWPRAMMAAMFATLAAARIGRQVQRYITTDADPRDARLVRIREYRGRRFGRHLKVYLSGS